MLWLLRAVCALSAASLAQSAAASLAQSATPAERAAALLAKMSVADKVQMLHGVSSPGYTGATAANAALGIPALQLNDGRQGFRPNDGNRGQTAFPCELAVAATFDTGMFRAFGAAMGAEFAGKGANVVLAPMLILARVPQSGRVFESCGEDPELGYAFAKAHIMGAQSNVGVISNADDFVLNNQETARVSISAVADERTRFEIYYRAYKGAIDGGAGSFMCSYNKVSGTYSCENAETLGDLKSPNGLNFSGWVLSDWGGTHSTTAAALAGLDQEMPGGDFFGAALAAAVASGAVPTAVLDDKVLRVLTPMFAAGLFDMPACPSCTPDANVTSPAHTALARALGAAGTVLLKNAAVGTPPARAPALPMDEAVRSIVVIGDDGDASPDCCGAGSGGLDPPYVISPLAGIRARAPAGVNVSYVPTPTGTVALTQYYDPVRADHFLDFICFECTPTYAPLRVEGYASASPCAGCTELVLLYNAANASNLVVPVDFPPPYGYAYVRPLAYALPLDSPQPSAVLELWSGMDTPQGAPPRSHLDFFTLATDASRAEAAAAGYSLVAAIARLALAPQGPDFAAVAAAAAAADVAVVCVSTPSSEGADRPDLNLAAVDDALIAAVAAAQPRTAVVLHNPGAVVMPWADAAAAIVAQWFPGQEMGNSLADVLFGDVNPSGRTPVTFPVLNSDTPLKTPEQYPGVNGTVTYTEQLLIGYRYFDAANVTPRFAFGHGLSYTTFAYSDLVVAPPDADGAVAVSFAITNAGGVDGREVPQLYVGFPPAAGEPPRSLRAFTALPIAAGATAPVAFTLQRRDYSIWAPTPAYAWQVVPGQYSVSVGASSRDIRLVGSFTV